MVKVKKKESKDVNKGLGYAITSYKGREVDDRKDVSIYRNLNNGKLSIKQGNLVVGHADELYVRVKEYKVLESGRQKVLREKVKNVHAYINGQLVTTTEFNNKIVLNGKKIVYNPYKMDNFKVEESGINATYKYLKITSDGVMVGYDGLSNEE